MSSRKMRKKINNIFELCVENKHGCEQNSGKLTKKRKTISIFIRIILGENINAFSLAKEYPNPCVCIILINIFLFRITRMFERKLSLSHQIYQKKKEKTIFPRNVLEENFIQFIDFSYIYFELLGSPSSYVLVVSFSLYTKNDARAFKLIIYGNIWCI